MAKKPPSYLYGDNITLRVCTGVDLFQNPVWREYPVEHVNLPAATGTVVTAANTDASRRSLMFVDSVYSAPQLDWFKLKRESENAGQRMQVIQGDEVYTVEAIDCIKDEYRRLDHWEVELV